MKIEADINQGQHKIDAYATGSITVAGIPYATNIIITPQAVIEGRLPGSVNSLAQPHVMTLLEHKPEVVLFGSGESGSKSWIPALPAGPSTFCREKAATSLPHYFKLRMNAPLFLILNS